MSTEIVAGICPPPEWKLAAGDIHHMADALEGLYQEFKPAFARRDQAVHGWMYLKGLLSDLPRKVTERIALRFETCVRSLQHFIGRSPWAGVVAGETASPGGRHAGGGGRGGAGRRVRDAQTRRSLGGGCPPKLLLASSQSPEMQVSVSTPHNGFWCG
jgi:hypothetical protein